MNTLDKNPWKVESIQEFSCLKCPECFFFTKEQNYFEDHAIANHPLSAILFDETMSSYEIEDNFKEEVLDEINHVNVGDIKKEPTEQDTSEDPFDICDTNIKQEDEHFMSSSPNKRVISDNELSLNHENKPKKLVLEQREVRTVVFNSSQHVTPREKRINYQNHSVVATSIKEVKKPSDVHETPIPVIPENKPKIRQRKQNILVRNEVALEKDQQISIIAKRDTIEYSPSHASASLESKTNSISRINYSGKERFFYGHYNCEHCGQTFFGDQAKRNFTRHLKKHTPQPKVYPTCKFCNKVCKYQSEVKRHETACFYKQMQQKGNYV